MTDVIREGMQPLVDRLRHLTQAATTDKFGDQTFWSDLQLQSILDDNARQVSFLMLPLWGGSTRVKVRAKRWMINPDDVAILDDNGQVIHDKIGDIGEWSHKQAVIDGVDSAARHLAGSWFDLWSAAADVWEAKAAQRAHFSQIKAGANTIRMQNQFQHCVQQRDYYRSKIIGRVRQ